MPVRSIPKEFLVTSMGCDMVNNSSLGQLTFGFALNTEWMNF
ncbi:hypothetical protein Javan255_0033 [Streptococcus phage Javan255]|nr:hypothetical protein Javan255_0033 [Streptococcus phage Javan255]